MLIFHLTSKEGWVEAVWKLEYRDPSLEKEGFIHASTPEQVLATANRYYTGRDNMVLLAIDTERLVSELRWETAASVDDTFPHIYGPLNLDAVTQALDFRPGEAGRFVELPPGLDFERYGDSIWLRAENFDGSNHWAHPALFGRVDDGFVQTRTGYATVVAREDGAFTSNWSTRGHYWQDRWFNVIRLQNPAGHLDGYYCNIAKPLPFDGRTVRYVDLQLDVRVFVKEDGSLATRLLDEDEFEEAQSRYGYDDELVTRCYEAVEQIEAMVRARQYPFDA